MGQQDKSKGGITRKSTADDPGGEVQVLIFGQLTDVTRTSSIVLNNIADTDQLVSKLEQRFPGLKQLKYLVAVDHQMITGNVQLKTHSAVALLPPFSGG